MAENQPHLESEQVERVARAIYAASEAEALKLGAGDVLPGWDGDDEDAREFGREMARAAIAALQHPVASSEAPTADQQDDWAKSLLEKLDKAIRMSRDWQIKGWPKTSDAVFLTKREAVEIHAAVAKLRPVVEALKWCVRLLKDNSPVSAGYAAAQAGDRALRDLGEIA